MKITFSDTPEFSEYRVWKNKMVHSLLPTLILLMQTQREIHKFGTHRSLFVFSVFQSRSFPLPQLIHAGRIVGFAVGSLGCKKTNRWYLHSVSTLLEALLTEGIPY